MAVSSGKNFMSMTYAIATFRLRQVFTGIVRKDIGLRENYFSRWRCFLSKHTNLGARPLISRRVKLGTFITSSLLASRGIGFWSSAQSEAQKSEMAEQSPPTTDDVIIEEADRLYHSNEPLKLYTFMVKHKDSNNANVQWRLCRACREVIQMKSTTAADKKKLTYEAMGYAEKCLDLDKENYACHKWFAICISEVGDYEGAKAKIKNSYVIRDHFKKAIELNSSDATCYHLMGLWCFTIADIAWYEKKVAQVVFGTPPSSTFEEALEYFQKAEEVRPNFYSMNLLMLGRTYLKLNKKDLAEKFFKQTKKYPSLKNEDDEAITQADKYLQQF